MSLRAASREPSTLFHRVEYHSRRHSRTACSDIGPARSGNMMRFAINARENANRFDERTIRRTYIALSRSCNCKYDPAHHYTRLSRDDWERLRIDQMAAV